MAENMEAIVKTLLNTPQGAAVLGNMDKIKSFTSSAEGQDLLKQLSGSGGDAVKKAAAAAAGGDKNSAQRMISTLTSTPEGKQLIQSIAKMIK